MLLLHSILVCGQRHVALEEDKERGERAGKGRGGEVVPATIITNSADKVPSVLKNPIQFTRVILLSSVALMYQFQHTQISQI
jgi:hypothetical protein